MNLDRALRLVTLSITTALLVGAAAGVALAQEEPQEAFVSDVNAGSLGGMVSMDGAVVAPDGDDGGYWFSDGTDVTTITIATATTAATAAEVPLLTLMNIVGTATSDGIEVSSWAPLDMITPAVIRTPQEAKEAFQGWIIVQNSQAPAE